MYVSFNYRVGVLGYPVGNEAEAKGALNLGHKDAVAALQWVQANIGAFGGDSKKVCCPSFNADRNLTKMERSLYSDKVQARC